MKEKMGDAKIVKWALPEKLTESKAVAYRNHYAKKLELKRVEEIIKEYVGLSENEMEALMNIAKKKMEPFHFRGIGIELGAGCGLLSSLIAKKESVEKIYALEIVERMATKIIPMVAKTISKNDKVIPVVGSFNDLKLRNNSIDFIVEIGSLHHSDNLVLSFKESARVLKKGGVMVLFDRCQPNSYSDEHVKRTLSEKYSAEWMERHGYPPNQTLSRGENGEHEYRLFEWENAFQTSGLSLYKRKNLRSAVSFKVARKSIKKMLLFILQTLRIETISPRYLTLFILVKE